MSEPWTVPGYDVEVMLGFGESGEVWRARERATGERVALKRLRDGATCPQADRLALLSSPHLLRLRAVVGEVLVLDLATGGSLAGLLARRGRLEPGEVVTVVAPVAAALAEAHAAGLVHGSVSASSVLLTADGMPLLADLERGPDAGGGPGGSAGDVRALAALCWLLLTGSSLPALGADPSGGAGPAAQPLGPSAELGPAAELGLPAELVAAVRAGLADGPGRRPDAADFGALLRRAHVAVPVRLTGGPPPGGAVLRPPRRGHRPGLGPRPGLGVRTGLTQWAGVGRLAGRGRGPARSHPAEGTAPVGGVASAGAGPGAPAGVPEPHGSGGSAGDGSPQSWRRSAAGPGSPPSLRRAARRPGAHRSRAAGRSALPVVGLVLLVLLAAVVGWVSGRGQLAGADAVAPLDGAAARPAGLEVSRPGAQTARPAGAASDGTPTRPQPAQPRPPEPQPSEPQPSEPQPSEPPPLQPQPSPPQVSGGADAGPAWTLVLDGLDASRARAFAAADRDALRQVWAGGSAGLAADQDLVGALAARGHRAHGLRHAVRELQVVRQSTTRVRLRVVDVLAAHEVRDDAGALVRWEAARPPADWLVDLAATSQGWRLVSVSPD